MVVDGPEGLDQQCGLGYQHQGDSSALKCMYDSSAYIWTLWSLIAFVYCSFFRHSFSQLEKKKGGGEEIMQ